MKVPSLMLQVFCGIPPELLPPEGSQKEPRGAKREPKGAKRKPKGAKREPKIKIIIKIVKTAMAHL